MLRNILETIRTSPFLGVMVDETTDKSSKEQLRLAVRWVSEDFTVSEEFLGLLLSFFNRCTEHCVCYERCLSSVPDSSKCYDGCSTMTGANAIVAVKIMHSTCVSDTIKQIASYEACCTGNYQDKMAHLWQNVTVAMEVSI